MSATEIYKEWMAAFSSINTPTINRDTAARIMAVVYMYGNNEAFVYNQKFLADIEHIKGVYGIDGGNVPDADIVELIKQYTNELEEYYQAHRNDETGNGAVFHSPAPKWAINLFDERYKIKLIN